MPLTWDLTKIDNEPGLHNEATEEGRWEWQKTQVILHRTMSVGIWRITEENYEKFFTRMLLVTDVYGTPLIQWNEQQGKHVDVDVSLADIKRRIGLRTNADTLTDNQFKTFFFDHFLQKAWREVDKQKKAA